MANTDRTTVLLESLRACGVGISIDDFGTGYSSLAYLRRFPIDKVKIDISFIREITTNADDAAIALAIIHMAHSLSLDVIAEGVETSAQFSYLRRHGCDQMQGYYFSPPLPVGAVEEMLRGGVCLPVSHDDKAPPPATLLLVDDDPHVLTALEMLLADDGYLILTATNAKEGFEVLAIHQVQVLLCDERLPGMSGTDFLARVKDMHPETLRIVLSGCADDAAFLGSINRGEVYRYYTKPWDAAALRHNIGDAFRHHRNLQHSRTGADLAKSTDNTRPDRSDDRVTGEARGQAGDQRDRTVVDALRGVLPIRSATAAAELLQRTAQQLEATVVPAADAPPDALPIDLSLAEGPPLLAVVELPSPARTELERALPRFTDDAPQAVDLLRQTEISPVRHASGHAAASSIARDITDRNRADEVQLLMAAIVESSDDAILSKTLDGIILSWNTAAQWLYGYTAEEIVGKSVSLLVPPDRPQEVADILAKLRRGETVEHFESSRVHKDGHLVPVSLTISPVRNASGHVAAASSISRDITARNRQRHLERIVRCDALTGLGNRLAIDEDLPGMQDRFHRYRHGFCIAMLDIDHFKSFNDSYGHQTGDRVLAEVGAAIASEIRPADLAYRYGGDEILIIYLNQTIATTSKAVQRIQHRVERLASHTTLPVPVTLSGGVAEAQAGERYDTILRRADRALYQAKHDGRNRVCQEPHQVPL